MFINKYAGSASRRDEIDRVRFSARPRLPYPTKPASSPPPPRTVQRFYEARRDLCLYCGRMAR